MPFLQPQTTQPLLNSFQHYYALHHNASPRCQARNGSTIRHMLGLALCRPPGPPQSGLGNLRRRVDR